jgi:hypothetical protein
MNGASSRLAGENLEPGFPAPRRAVVLCTERASRLESGALAVAPSCFVR